jgi:hypothetical protein
MLLVSKRVVCLLPLRKDRSDESRAAAHGVLVPVLRVSICADIVLVDDSLLVLLDLLGIEGIERL